MTADGPLATVDNDDRFRGDFDNYEPEVVVELYPPSNETRRSFKGSVRWGEQLDNGHALCVSLDENGVGEHEPVGGLVPGDRLVITTDGFDRTLRARNPTSREGESTAIGQDTRVYTTHEWGEYMMGLSEARHEAKLDRQRERHFDENGHY